MASTEVHFSVEAFYCPAVGAGASPERARLAFPKAHVRENSFYGCGR